MFRKITLLICIGLVAGVSIAKPKAYTFDSPTGSATAITNTFKGISGSINEIVVAVSDAASTGNVAVAYIPRDGYSAAVNMATNDVTATKSFKPRLDGTDTAGVVLSNASLTEQHTLVGEQVRVIVTGSPTGVIWRTTIKIDQ